MGGRINVCCVQLDESKVTSVKTIIPLYSL